MKSAKINLIFFLSVFLLADDSNMFMETAAQPESNQVVIHWITQNEENVKTFVVKRSTNNRNYTDLGEVKAQGPGFKYEFIDKDVFFESNNVFYYKIAAMDGNGKVIQESEYFTALPKISSIYKTWGAIKAIFR